MTAGGENRASHGTQTDTPWSPCSVGLAKTWGATPRWHAGGVHLALPHSPSFPEEAGNPAEPLLEQPRSQSPGPSAA